MKRLAIAAVGLALVVGVTIGALVGVRQVTGAHDLAITGSVSPTSTPTTSRTPIDSPTVPPSDTPTNTPTITPTVTPTPTALPTPYLTDVYRNKHPFGSQVYVTFTSVPGVEYDIYYSLSLEPANWLFYDTLKAAASTTTFSLPLTLEAYCKVGIRGTSPTVYSPNAAGILPKTIKVRVVVTEDQYNRNAVAFQIKGELWAQPVPLDLLLKTEIDLETGDVSVQEQTGA